MPKEPLLVYSHMYIDVALYLGAPDDLDSFLCGNCTFVTSSSTHSLEGTNVGTCQHQERILKSIMRQRRCLSEEDTVLIAKINDGKVY